MNKAWTETLGWSSSELKSVPFTEFIHPDDYEPTIRIIRQRMNVNESYGFENRYRTRSGGYRWLSWRSFYDSSTNLFYAMARDITLQKTQAELIEELQTTARIGAYEINLANGRCAWTREVHRIFEHLPGLAIDAMTFLQFFEEPDRTTLERLLAACARGEPFEAELECVTTLGKHRWVRLVGKPVQVAGRVDKIYCIIQDVSSSKRSELRERHFISVVSHELRTPLTSIRGALSLLKQKVADPTSTQGSGMIEIADRNAERLERLVEDILDVERIEGDVFRIQRSKVNLSTLMAETLAACRLLSEQAGIQLVVGDCRSDIWGYADPDRIAQVLTNLISNALRHSPDAGQITVNCHATSTSFYCEVQDNGRGVPKEYHRLIFERFTQVPDQLTGGGSGLGLYICRMIISRHDGEIGIKAQPGGGSRFYFEIPLWPEANGDT